MPDPFLGEIRMFGGNFAPRGWALCNGQLLPIAQHNALFALLGTTYGGDGRTTFALPDLRGRVSMHPGSGPGLTRRALGEAPGAERVSLSVEQLPAHAHDVACRDEQGTCNTPVGHVHARAQHADFAPEGDATMSSTAIGTTGQGEAHDNVQPSLCVNHIIALQGVFPSRN